MERKIFGVFVVALSLLLASGVNVRAQTVEATSDEAIANEASLLIEHTARNSREGWVPQDGMWFFYRGNVRQTGWLQVDNNRFFLNPPVGAFGHLWGQPPGRMLTGLVHDGTGFYFLNPPSGDPNYVAGQPFGAMLTGRLRIDGGWSLFHSSGRWQGRFNSYPVYGQFLYRWWPPSTTHRITTIPIRDFSFDSTWQSAMITSINNWNSQNIAVNFVRDLTSENRVSVESRAENWLGVHTVWCSQWAGTTHCLPEEVGGVVNRFEIVLNSRSITARAGNLSAYITSVFTHELGHALGLRDNPESAPWPSGSIMGYSRNRNVTTAPTIWDVNNVNRIY